MERALPIDDAARRHAREPEEWKADEIADLLDSLVQEAGENLQTLETQAVDLERHPDDRERVDTLFRAAHNLKGLARIAGVEKLVIVAQCLEFVLDQYRDRLRTPDAAGTDLILKSVDAVRTGILPCLAERRPVTADLSGLLDGYAVWGRTGAPPPSPTPAPPAAAAPAPPPSIAVAATSAPPAPPPAPTEAGDPSLRVRLTRLDDLLNLVGELVITRIRLEKRLGDLRNLAPELERLEHSLEARPGAPAAVPNSAAVRAALAPLREDADRLRRVFEELTRDLEESADAFHGLSNELQSQVMKVRMVPLTQLFQKYPRMVRDVARGLGKEVRLTIEGEDTEVDKVLLDAMSDPLMHLLRNAVDHGLEPPDERVRRGKPREGEVRLRASQKSGQVYLEVEDDGGGIDPEKIRRVAVRKGILGEAEAAALSDAAAVDLIFRPGFSTAAVVTEVSGRGVGLDVVKRNIAALKGSLEVEPLAGGGTRFRARLPLTLAVLQAMLVTSEGNPLALPMSHVQELLRIEPGELRPVGAGRALHLRGESLFVERLSELLGFPAEAASEEASVSVVVVGSGDRRMGLIVDRFLGKQDLVVKSLGTLLRRVPGVLGSSVLGDGRLLLILDVPAILESLDRGRSGGGGALPREAAAAPAGEGASSAGRILFVDDSRTVRDGARRILLDAGFEVVEAEDGVDGLARAEQEAFDLISTDVMMPRMDGYELVRRLRALAAYRHTPIIMVSSRGEKMDKVRGFDAGADDYVTKPFDRETLLAAVRNNLRRRA